jgi:hypothetical protein
MRTSHFLIDTCALTHEATLTVSCLNFITTLITLWNATNFGSESCLSQLTLLSKYLPQDLQISRGLKC